MQVWNRAPAKNGKHSIALLQKCSLWNLKVKKKLQDIDILNPSYCPLNIECTSTCTRFQGKDNKRHLARKFTEIAEGIW